MPGGQRQNKEGERPAVLRPEHDVERAEVSEGVCKDEEYIDSVQRRESDDTKHGEDEIEKEEKRGENDGALQLLRAVESVVPTPEIEEREDEGNRREGTPIATRGDDQKSRAENQKIGEKDDLLVFAGTDQQRRKEAAKKRKQGDPLGVTAQRHGGHDGGHDDQARETDLPAEKGVVPAAGPYREQQGGLAQRGDAFRKIRISFAEKPLAPGQKRGAQENTDGDAARWPDPVIVKSVFQKERYRDDDRQDSDAIEPAPGDERFEINRGAGLGIGSAEARGGNSGNAGLREIDARLGAFWCFVCHMRGRDGLLRRNHRRNWGHRRRYRRCTRSRTGRWRRGTYRDRAGCFFKR
jgi:hypothetical protein